MVDIIKKLYTKELLSYYEYIQNVEPISQVKKIVKDDGK